MILFFTKSQDHLGTVYKAPSTLFYIHDTQVLVL